MRLLLAFRAVLFTILLPGTTLVVIPYALLPRTGVVAVPPLSFLTIAASVLGMLGAGTLLYCIWGFAAHGRGTLAPIDRPKVLVVRGLYRCARNPMYLSVLAVMLSEALFFRSTALLIYAGLGFIAFHLFVTYAEEPQLRRRFGQAYDDYCQAVPRWGIASRPFSG